MTSTVPSHRDPSTLRTSEGVKRNEQRRYRQHRRAHPRQDRSECLARLDQVSLKRSVYGKSDGSHNIPRYFTGEIGQPGGQEVETQFGRSQLPRDDHLEQEIPDHREHSQQKNPAPES
jgi:hypothetical protein